MWKTISMFFKSLIRQLVVFRDPRWKLLYSLEPSASSCKDASSYFKKLRKPGRNSTSHLGTKKGMYRVMVEHVKQICEKQKENNALSALRNYKWYSNLSHISENDYTLERILTRKWRCSKLVFLTPYIGTVEQPMPQFVGIPTQYRND